MTDQQNTTNNQPASENVSSHIPIVGSAGCANQDQVTTNGRNAVAARSPAARSQCPLPPESLTETALRTEVDSDGNVTHVIIDCFVPAEGDQIHDWVFESRSWRASDPKIQHTKHDQREMNNCSRLVLAGRQITMSPSCSGRGVFNNTKRERLRFMQLIIECDDEGQVFIYEEADKHHKRVEPQRASERTRRTLETSAEECAVSPGEYLVIPLVYVD